MFLTIILLINLFVVQNIYAIPSYTFWQYTVDRFNKASLVHPVVVPSNIDPYQFLSQYVGYKKWTMHREGKTVFMAQIATEGYVPVLNFHKINRASMYGLTPERFRQIFEHINENDWYLVSDYQYITGDFTRVPTGFKPIVMGADDATYGSFLFHTTGDSLTGKVKRDSGKPLLDRNSMVAILERHAPRENGRINFTFYISYDAIPFRQLDGYRNPGFPYKGIPVVREKMRYLDQFFILGNHTLSHKYADEMTPKQFANDVLQGWKITIEYLGGVSQTLHTMAFPYGTVDLSEQFKKEIMNLNLNGQKLAGAFNVNDKLAPAPGALKDKFNIPRINVDNQNWRFLMRILKGEQIMKVSREVVWEPDSKILPVSKQSLGAHQNDRVWVLIQQ